MIGGKTYGGEMRWDVATGGTAGYHFCGCVSAGTDFGELCGVTTAG
ncbi:hypothetical protein ACIBQ0_15855 [Nocardia nova]